MRYFWRVLDIEGTGRMTVGTINVFFRDVTRTLAEGSFDTPNIADVKVRVTAAVNGTILTSLGPQSRFV